MIAEALEYASKYHLPVFPLRGKKPITEHGFKDATIDQNQIKAWWGKNPSANIGIATGRIFVIDIDQKPDEGKFGEESFQELESKLGKLPDTWEVLTGSGGRHLYFKCPSGHEVRNSTSEIAEWIDIRGVGGYIVCPPSIHPDTGRTYEWECGYEPGEIPIADIPDAWLKAIETASNQTEGSTFEMPETVPEGKRNEILFKYGASLRAKSVPALRTYKLMNEFNNQRCIPPLPDEELDRTYDSVMRYQQGKPEQEIIEQEEKRKTKESIIDALYRVDAINKYRTHDRGFGALFADLFKDRHRYCGQKKDYLKYDGKRWVQDVESLEARRTAQKLSDQIIKYAAAVDESEGRLYLKAVTKLCNIGNRENMLKDARPIYPISADELDKDDYLLNVQNGTLDLSGDVPVFREHKPDDLLSKICNVNYDPSAKCPEWVRFLDEIMIGDAEKIKYLQKICGLSMTGNTEQETCFILYGSTTRNGKSTFCETMLHMLGDYGLTMKPESLAVKPNADSRQASGDIARLAGCRFLNASEPPKKMLFDVALLKSLLGRDTITARHLHEREFQFIPKFKLVMNTNFLPNITDATVFSSGRINVISFDRHFEEHEQDKGLKNRLRQPEELSGLLNWCIEGLRLYRSEGLTAPDAVKQATEDYRSDSDKIGNFIAECLTKTGKNSKAGDVYKAYSDWCESNGFGCENKQNFFAEMKSKKIYAKSGTVDGSTCRNIIKGYSIGSDIETDANGFMKVDPETLEDLPF